MITTPGIFPERVIYLTAIQMYQTDGVVVPNYQKKSCDSFNTVRPSPFFSQALQYGILYMNVLKMVVLQNSLYPVFKLIHT